MAYPKNLIQQGETVALDLRPHWWYFSRNIFTGIPLAILVIFLFNLDSGFVKDASSWLVVILLVAWSAWLVLKYFQWTMTYFVVTDRRVIYRTGVLSKKGVEIPLERINNINFHQRIIDRIIGAGDLDIESAGRDGQSHFDFVRHPDGVQHEIYREMEKRNMPQNFMQPAPATAPTAPAAAPPSVPEQIEQLAQLKAQGHITDAEYEQKKAELLDRM
ncbi:MAG: PH domain-containing protein [Acidimicrobiia bacterium]